MLLGETKKKQEELLACIPVEAVQCGAFLVDPSSVRTLLAQKYQVRTISPKAHRELQRDPAPQCFGYTIAHPPVACLCVACPQEIRSRLLTEHRDATLKLAAFIEHGFKTMEARLNSPARSIEEVVELEEFIAGTTRTHT